MKNLIYQYWDGDLRSGVAASTKNMAEYAERIGADHKFFHNQEWYKGKIKGNYKYWGSLHPVLTEEFDEYDNVLFLDADIFAVDGLEENVFDGFDADLGMCTEPFQPKQRVITRGNITSKQDEKWAKMVKRKYNLTMPRNEDNLLKVYNTGFIMYSREGRMKARKLFVNPNQYITECQSAGLIPFYSLDQNYLHAMSQLPEINFVEIDNDWNSYIHYTRDLLHPDRYLKDHRTPTSKFVHVQAGGMDSFSEERLHRIVNLPQSEWGFTP